MSTEPTRTRRKPNLEGLDGPTPEEQTRRVEKATAVDPVIGVTTGGRSEPEPAEAPAAPPVPVDKVKKQSYDLRESVVNAARGTWALTQFQTGYRSFSAFVEAAIEAETARVAERYNEGKPFPPMEAGKIPVGRRLG